MIAAHALFLDSSQLQHVKTVYTVDGLNHTE